MKNSLHLILLSFFLFAIPFSSNAQLQDFENIEDITKKGFFKTYFKSAFKDFTDFGDPFSLSGGIGLNMRSYNAYGELGRQDPFFWTLNSNLNIRIYRLNLPFSLLVSAKNTESSLPNYKELIEAFKTSVKDRIEQKKQSFVRFGASPNYKWMKLHLGHRSMDFSKFTLSNLNFYGVGTELTPGKWRASAMYGRLAKAEPIDLSLVTPNFPVYQRLGWGAKLGYGNDNHSIDAIVFNAFDDPNSIFIPADNPDQLSPVGNLVLGLNGSTLIYKKFRLRGEFGLSGYAPNALDANGSNTGLLPNFLFQTRSTSDEYTAADVAFDYEAAKYTLGIQLKRIDSDYQSLGTFFFNNDIVDLVANLSFGLLDGKVQTNLSTGVQANNLRLLNPTTTRRFIGTIDMSWSPNDVYSMDANYSNNTTDVAYVLNQALDSLNAVIVTNDVGMNINYSIPDNAGNNHSFNLSGNVQQVIDDIDDPFESASSQMFVANLVYGYGLAESNWNFSAKTNFNQNEISGSLTRRYGGGFGVSKSLLEGKMNIGIDADYFQNYNVGFENNSNLNGNLTWSYDIAKGLNSNFSLGLLRTVGSFESAFTELTGTAGAQYYFDYLPAKVKAYQTKVKQRLIGRRSKEVEEPIEPTEDQFGNPLEQNPEGETLPPTDGNLDPNQAPIEENLENENIEVPTTEDPKGDNPDGSEEEEPQPEGDGGNQ